MRIATWNLRFNVGAPEWPGLWNRIGLDLLFLQESERPGTSHPFHWESVPGNKWGSAIVLSSGRIEPIPVPGCEGWVVGGDFNFTIGERQPGEFQVTEKAERAVIQRMADLGVLSCWSMSHPDLPLEQTLRWVSDNAPYKSTPFHCDGLFVPHRWKGKVTCEVFTSSCYRKSDHNPVVAWIDE